MFQHPQVFSEKAVKKDINKAVKKIKKSGGKQKRISGQAKSPARDEN